jgi:hypothetical protein
VRERYFEIVGRIHRIERIAIGRSIRQRSRLARLYGKGRWRKLKGIATVRFADGVTQLPEVHWYELTLVGKREIKIKRLL